MVIRGYNLAHFPVRYDAAMPGEATSRDTVFEGVRFNVVRKAFPRRNGGTMQREVVVPHDAVVILPLLGDQTVVLIHNHRHAIERTLWELPAGTLEEGEQPETCAARELTEETGYTASRLSRLQTFYSSPGFCTEKLATFLATDLEKGDQSLDATERIEVAPRPMPEVLEMIRTREIEDAKTIATLLYYHSFLTP